MEEDDKTIALYIVTIIVLIMIVWITVKYYKPNRTKSIEKMDDNTDYSYVQDVNNIQDPLDAQSVQDVQSGYSWDSEQDNIINVENGIMRPINIELCDNGTLETCYGQNPNTPYIIADFGQYDANDTSEEAVLGAFSMNNNQAVVLFGLSPPESKYWSFIPYLYKDPKCGETELFATISDSFKMTDIPSGEIYGREIAIIYSCNPCLIDKLYDRYINDGYFVYKNPIPKYPNTAKYFILGRVSGFGNDQMREDYLYNTNLELSKYEDDSCVTTNLYDESSILLRKRSIEGSECNNIGPIFNKFKNTFLKTFTVAFPLYKYKLDGKVNRFRQDINYDSGFDCIANCTECLGDNRDTVYSVCTIPTRFTVSDVLIMFGVNHNVTGKSLFTQIGVYDTLKQYGINSIDIFDKEKPFYAIFISKVPLDINKIQKFFPKNVATYFYRVPPKVQVITVTERAYLQVLGNPGISADPSSIILPIVELRSLQPIPL